MEDSVLIEHLIEFAEELGKTPTSTEMDDEGPHTARTYQNHFGTWNSALEEAKLTVNRRRGVSNEDLLEEMSRVYDMLGHTPTAKSMDKLADYSPSTYIRRFGSWGAALEKAGVDSDREPNIQTEELLEEILRLRDKYGRVPKSTEMDSEGEYSTVTYRERFGSWQQAVEKCGLEPYRPHGIPEEELLDEIRRMADGDRPPTSEDMRYEGKYTRSTYQRRFGSWNNAVSEAGFDLLVRSPGNSLRKAVYGEGWNEEKRGRVRERDGYECVICGVEQEEYQSEYGMALDVHHIRPAREFENGKERNSMSNLVTLCRACHMEWEGLDLPEEYRPHPASRGADAIR